MSASAFFAASCASRFQSILGAVSGSAGAAGGSVMALFGDVSMRAGRLRRGATAAAAAAGTAGTEAGVSGAMPQLAACTPQGCYEVFAAFKDGDPSLAAEKAERLEKADELMRELGVAGLKYGCDLNGYFGGNPRLPRLPLRADQRARVEDALRELRN